MSAAGLGPKQPGHVCGREIPVMVLPPDLLRFYGWQPDRVWSVVEWCGHWQEELRSASRAAPVEIYAVTAVR